MKPGYRVRALSDLEQGPDEHSPRVCVVKKGEVGLVVAVAPADSRFSYQVAMHTTAFGGPLEEVWVFDGEIGVDHTGECMHWDDQSAGICDCGAIPT